MRSSESGEEERWGEGGDELGGIWSECIMWKKNK